MAICVLVFLVQWFCENTPHIEKARLNSVRYQRQNARFHSDFLLAQLWTWIKSAVVLKKTYLFFVCHFYSSCFVCGIMLKIQVCSWGFLKYFILYNKKSATQTFLIYIFVFLYKAHYVTRLLTTKLSKIIIWIHLEKQC